MWPWGFVGGILTGADKLSRVAWLQSDPAIAEVPSQSIFSRFFGLFSQKTSSALSRLHVAALDSLPSRKEGYTLDLDGWSLLHEDGHQQGVALGYTRLGLKPCHRPLIGCVAEAKLVANHWLRRGDAHCVNGAADFLRATLATRPAHIHFSLLRADSGFAAESVLSTAEEQGLPYIVAWRLDQKIQRHCRHDDALWHPTEIAGLEVQELEQDRPGRRLLVIRQRIAERSEAGGKPLLDVPGYRFQSLLTNLPAQVSALAVWRRYNGRGDSENRIKGLGDQFEIKRLCCQNFWATEAMHHLAIAAYNLCVLLQRRLGQLEKCELNTLRWRLFSGAAVWSRARGKPTLKLTVRGAESRHWWLEILAKLTAPPNCPELQHFRYCTSTGFWNTLRTFRTMPLQRLCGHTEVRSSLGDERPADRRAAWEKTMNTFITMARRAIVVGAVVLCSASLNAQSSSPKFRAVAFYTARNDQAHISFVNEANRWFPQMAAKYKFSYEATTNWHQLNAEFLKQCQVVLFLDTRPDDPVQREAFENYMKHGGAWMGFHFAAFALTPSDFPQNWDWYHQKFLGSGEYVSNTWRPTSAVLRVEDTNHPATKNLSETFKSAPNEWYRWKNDLRANPDIKVLLSIDPASFPLGTGPKPHEIWHSGDYPVVWTNQKYKMIYMNVGHNDIDYEHKTNQELSFTFANEKQNKLILDGLLWLGGAAN